MATLVNVHEAKTHLSKLLDRARDGEEFVLAKAGKPFARLVPLEAKPNAPRRPGLLKGLVIPDDWLEPMSDAEIREMEEGAAADPLGAGRRP